jgi:hypothetical protein
MEGGMTRGDCLREISPEFMEQLATASGILRPIFDRVQKDDTLSLEVRDGYVDIYYRGGRLLGLHEVTNGRRYRAEFDEGYLPPVADPHMDLPPGPADVIENAEGAGKWVRAFAAHKQIMDLHFFEHAKIEREYQQAVVRDNNRHKWGDESDYIVLDIEYTQSAKSAGGQARGRAQFRFDMIGLHWSTADRRGGRARVTPVIIEMKVGDAAIRSRPKRGTGDLTPGLRKHVDDIEQFLGSGEVDGPSARFEQLRRELLGILRTKQQLGLKSLPKAWHTERMKSLSIGDIGDRPEVVFFLANHNPRSDALKKELAEIDVGTHADYKVAWVRYAGYALFEEGMVPLDEFIRNGGAR